MKLLFALVLLGVASYVSAVNVTQCADIEKPIENLNELITIGACKKPPCRLRKNRSVEIKIKIKPETDVDKLANSVNANIVGVPFPFVGVDGTDACNNIYKPDGETQVGCPLKAGEDYVYKNKIDVLSIYPRIKIIVHWGLKKPDGKDIICFEVPARITN